jgi:Flp pilus assembly protein TadG
MQKGADERGQVLILTAAALLFIMVIAALVIDVCMAYLQLQRDQNGADAIALSVAQDLAAGQGPQQVNTSYPVNSQGSSLWETNAWQLATSNDTSAQYTVQLVSANEVQVTGTQAVPTWFARVIGVNDFHLNVSATAQVGPTQQTTGAVPIAVSLSTYEGLTPGQQIDLIEPSDGGQDGNYGLLDFSSPSSLSTLIAGGNPQPLSIGDSFSTQPGEHTGLVGSGINCRWDAAHDTACSSCPTYSSNPLLMTVPIVNTLDVNGKKTVQIVGFAEFQITAPYDSVGHCVQGLFVENAVIPGVPEVPTENSPSVSNVSDSIILVK